MDDTDDIPWVTCGQTMPTLWFEFFGRHDYGLGVFSEQANESVHVDFRRLWEQTGKVNSAHPEYSSRLLDGRDVQWTTSEVSAAKDSRSSRQSFRFGIVTDCVHKWS